MRVRSIGFLVTTMLVLVALSFVYAENIALEGKFIDVPYAYSVTPGSAEWYNLTHEERHNVSKIPNEVIDRMTPKALLDTVIAYPMKGPVYLYESYQEWFDFFTDSFYGLNKLVNSHTSAGEIVGLYKEVKVLGSREMQESDFMLLSMILAQDSILSKISEEELDMLLEETSRLEGQENSFSRLNKFIYLRALKYRDTNLFDSIVSNKEMKQFIETADKKVNIESLNIHEIHSKLTTAQSSSSASGFYIYTSRNTAIYVQYLNAMSDNEIQAEIQLYDSEWAGITTVAAGSNPTRTFNCHTYAWWSQVSPTFWMDDASAFVRDGSYLSDVKKTSGFNTIPSNMGSSVVGYFATNDYMNHSAKVYNSAKMISKWGQGFLVIHKPEDSPYFCGHCLNSDRLCKTIAYYKVNNVIMTPTE